MARKARVSAAAAVALAATSGGAGAAASPIGGPPVAGLVRPFLPEVPVVWTLAQPPAAVSPLTLPAALPVVPTPLDIPAYNCHVLAPENWSPAWRHWCCSHEELGCYKELDLESLDLTSEGDEEGATAPTSGQLGPLAAGAPAPFQAQGAQAPDSQGSSASAPDSETQDAVAEQANGDGGGGQKAGDKAAAEGDCGDGCERIIEAYGGPKPAVAHADDNGADGAQGAVVVRDTHVASEVNTKENTDAQQNHQDQKPEGAAKAPEAAEVVEKAAEGAGAAEDQKPEGTPKAPDAAEGAEKAAGGAGAAEDQKSEGAAKARDTAESAEKAAEGAGPAEALPAAIAQTAEAAAHSSGEVGSSWSETEASRETGEASGRSSWQTGESGSSSTNTEASSAANEQPAGVSGQTGEMEDDSGEDDSGEAEAPTTGHTDEGEEGEADGALGSSGTYGEEDSSTAKGTFISDTSGETLSRRTSSGTSDTEHASGAATMAVANEQKFLRRGGQIPGGPRTAGGAGAAAAFAASFSAAVLSAVAVLAGRRREGRRLELQRGDLLPTASDEECLAVE